MYEQASLSDIALYAFAQFENVQQKGNVPLQFRLPFKKVVFRQNFVVSLPFVLAKDNERMLAVCLIYSQLKNVCAFCV